MEDSRSAMNLGGHKTTEVISAIDSSLSRLETKIGAIGTKWANSFARGGAAAISALTGGKGDNGFTIASKPDFSSTMGQSAENASWRVNAQGDAYGPGQSTSTSLV